MDVQADDEDGKVCYIGRVYYSGNSTFCFIRVNLIYNIVNSWPHTTIFFAITQNSFSHFMQITCVYLLMLLYREMKIALAVSMWMRWGWCILLMLTLTLSLLLGYSLSSFMLLGEVIDHCSCLMWSCRCGHCQKLAPTWGDLAAYFNTHNKDVHIVKVCYVLVSSGNDFLP